MKRRLHLRYVKSVRIRLAATVASQSPLVGNFAVGVTMDQLRSVSVSD